MYNKIKYNISHMNISVILTGNVSVATFQSTEVRHELSQRDLEDLKETHILEQGVCHLRKHKPASLTHGCAETKTSNTKHESERIGSK